MQATLGKDLEQAYVAAYAVRRERLDGGPELLALRDAAIERFATLGFPTTHDEAWRFTNLAPFLKTYYAPADGRAFGGNVQSAHPALTFLNGRFVPEASTAVSKPGLRVGPRFESAGRLRPGICVNLDSNALAALNTAMFEEAAVIEIADGAVLDEPLILVFTTLADAPVAAYTRTLIIAGRDSQAQIVEMHVGASNTPYFSNSVTELVVGDGAVIEHYNLQHDGPAALYYGLLAVRQGASSSFTSHSLAFGAALARSEIAAVLDGEGADCQLNGLYAAGAGQHIDNYTTLEHARAHTTSHELYKGILDGNAHGVFHGRIIVRPEAQKTDAIQRNKNLLLSKDAVINTKPQLEIYADDVKCTHGATVGQVDEDAVFYLRSRGVPLADARALLTYAFAGDLVDRIRIESLRREVRSALEARLK